MQDQNKTEKANEAAGDRVNDFIQRNRKVIFSVTGIILITFIGLVIFLSVKENMDVKAAEKLEDLNRRYNEISFQIGEEDSNADVSSLLAELVEFAEKTKGLSGSKAWSLAAAIHSGREEWHEAEDAFLKAAKTGDRTYLGPVSLFNAAAAAEEQGKLDQAISLLQECLAHKMEFPAAPRAQFSIGRLNEQLGKNTDAIEAYRAVLINWPDMPVWPQLARSRIIAIEIAQ